MSILILDLELPRTGYLDLRIFPDGMAVRSTGRHPFYSTHEVVSLPQHGDLIDRDALPVSGINNYFNGKWIEFVNADDIENAQVIIPAEEAES